MEQQEFTQPEIQDIFSLQNQETEVRKKSKIKRILLFVSLGLLVVAGLLFAAYKLFYVKPVGDIKTTPTLLPIPTEILTPTPTVFEPTVTPIPTLPKVTPIPTKKVVVPSKMPTQIIVPTSTPVPPTSTPLPNPPKELRCEISASPMSGPAPLEVTLAYSVLNIGNNAYVTGAQWDFNGDGNWDTDLNINTGRVNYTYSDVGIYTVKLKTKLSDGRISECSSSVGVQPH